MAKSWPKPEVSEPDEAELLQMLQDAVTDDEVAFETSDGCAVEPDGVCQHGHPTWLVRYGLI